MTTMKRTLCVLGLLALIPMAAVADTLEERFERTLPFASGQSLALTNTNGGVVVESWDREEIEIVAEKKVRAKNDEDAARIMAALEIEIEESGEGLRIETRDPRRNSGDRSTARSGSKASGGSSS